MNILITGATGLLGSSLVSNLSKNHKIYAVVRNLEKIKIKSKNIEFIELNLFELDINKLPKNIDAVYYLAQSSKFREFPEEAADIFEININSPFKIINWAIKNKIRKFFYTSSGSVYSNSDKPLKESSSINLQEQRRFYPDSKMTAEILLGNYANYFETFAILRPFFIYGPKQKSQMLIPKLISNIYNDIEIILSNKNGIKINPVYVEDAAIALENLLNLKGEFVINIAGKEIVSIRELSEKIAQIINKKAKFSVIDKMEKDLIADTEIMENLLYIPKISLNEGIANLIPSCNS